MNERFYRPEDALLAGVCAELARRLGWNVWAIRGLFVFGLIIEPLATAVIYLILAVAMGLILGGQANGNRGAESEPPGGLSSPGLSDRARRIDELERKFRDLERKQR